MPPEKEYASTHPPFQDIFVALFNPGAWLIIRNSSLDDLSEEAKAVLALPMDDIKHTQWQALVLDGQVVEAIKQARQLGLDFPTAHALVNEFRQQEGLMPPKRRWWWPFS